MSTQLTAGRHEREHAAGVLTAGSTKTPGNTMVGRECTHAGFTCVQMRHSRRRPLDPRLAMKT